MSKEKNTKKENKYYSFKFIVIGDQSVGKTNIINRFAKKDFTNEYKVTIGMEFLSYYLKINNRVFNIQLWDTAGQERFHSIVKGYFSNSTCAIVVYDITQRSSFNSVKDWVEECKNYTNKNVLLLLVGNKTDLKDKREISTEEGREFAEKNGMEFFESSALTGDNIDHIFVSACQIINENLNNDLYDFNDPSNGIKIGMIDEDMEINEEIYTESFKLENKRKSNYKTGDNSGSKCNCVK